MIRVLPPRFRRNVGQSGGQVTVTDALVRNRAIVTSAIGQVALNIAQPWERVRLGQIPGLEVRDNQIWEEAQKNDCGFQQRSSVYAGCWWYRWVRDPKNNQGDATNGITLYNLLVSVQRAATLGQAKILGIGTDESNFNTWALNQPAFPTYERRIRDADPVFYKKILDAAKLQPLSDKDLELYEGVLVSGNAAIRQAEAKSQSFEGQLNKLKEDFDSKLNQLKDSVMAPFEELGKGITSAVSDLSNTATEIRSSINNVSKLLEGISTEEARNKAINSAVDTAMKKVFESANNNLPALLDKSLRTIVSGRRISRGVRSLVVGEAEIKVSDAAYQGVINRLFDRLKEEIAKWGNDLQNDPATQKAVRNVIDGISTQADPYLRAKLKELEEAAGRVADVTGVKTIISSIPYYILLAGGTSIAVIVTYFAIKNLTAK